MQSPLELSRQDPVFLSQPTPTFLLDRDLTIKAASRSYLAMAGREAEGLLEENVVDAFSRSDDPAGDYSPHFLESVEHVLRRRRPQQLSGIRHDVEREDGCGGFAERRWSLVNSPVLLDDAAVGVMVRVEDLGWLCEDLTKVMRCPDAGERTPGEERRSSEREAAVRTLLDALRANLELSEEVRQLQLALANRPGIELAKGVVMADRGCTADEAFETLRQLSMHSNVRLVDVATAVVYHATHRGERHLDSA